MPLRGASHYRTRSITIALVAGGHLAVLLVLASRSAGDRDMPVDERMASMFIELPDVSVPSARTNPGNHSGRKASRAPLPAAESPPAPRESTAIAESSVDWDLAARRASSREANRPDVHDFGFPKREPEPRETKPFGWDKTHTERVSALPEGGMLIRLNDNCAIILAPLPLGGCSLGKRKARGDLFDEMKGPVEPGDWR